MGSGEAEAKAKAKMAALFSVRGTVDFRCLLCPFGLLQDLLHKIPAPKWKVRGKLDRAARYLKYVALLAAILIWSMFLSRPFCRYLCPLGAFYSLFNKCGLYRMRVDETKCVDCKKCQQVCPMGVEVTKNINSLECIRCGKCRDVCSVKAIKRGF